MASVELVRGNPAAVREEVGWENIQRYRYRHYRRAFGPEWSNDNIGRFVASTTPEVWDDPNNGPRRSRRANPVAVIARSETNGSLGGLCYMADDASKTTRGVLKYVPRAAQEQAKLHVEGLISNRWAWGKEVIGEEDVVIECLAMALETRRRAQPTSVWPWAGETALEGTLVELGYVPEMNDDGTPAIENVPVHGLTDLWIAQKHFTATVGEVLDIAEDMPSVHDYHLTEV